MPGEPCRSTKGRLFPKCAPCAVKSSLKRAPSKVGKAFMETSVVTVFLLSPLTPQTRPPPPSSGWPPLPQHPLPSTHMHTTFPPKLLALVSTATKQKPTRFEKAANLTTSTQKGKDNSLGNSDLTLETGPQRSASPSGFPATNLKTELWAPKGTVPSLWLHPPFLERQRPGIYYLSLKAF